MAPLQTYSKNLVQEFYDNLVKVFLAKSDNSMTLPDRGSLEKLLENPEDVLRPIFEGKAVNGAISALEKKDPRNTGRQLQLFLQKFKNIAAKLATHPESSLDQQPRFKELLLDFIRSLFGVVSKRALISTSGPPQNMLHKIAECLEIESQLPPIDISWMRDWTNNLENTIACPEAVDKPEEPKFLNNWYRENCFVANIG